MSILFPRQSVIDGKRCWDMWWKEGLSLKKVSEKLETEGVVSPYTNRKFTPTAIRYAAWKWALDAENQQAAYQDVRQRIAAKGRIITDEDWKKIMVESARFIWGQTPKKVDQFVSYFGLQKYT